jgi:hypothetical protein
LSAIRQKDLIHVRPPIEYTTTPLPDAVEAAVVRLYSAAKAGSECALEFLLAWDGMGKGFRLTDLMISTPAERADFRIVLHYVLETRRTRPPIEWAEKFGLHWMPDDPPPKVRSLELDSQRLYGLLLDRFCTQDAIERHGYIEEGDWRDDYALQVTAYSSQVIPLRVKRGLIALFDSRQSNAAPEGIREIITAYLFSWWIPDYYAGFELYDFLRLPTSELANAVTLWDFIAEHQCGPPLRFKDRFEGLMTSIPTELWPVGMKP